MNVILTALRVFLDNVVGQWIHPLPAPGRPAGRVLAAGALNLS
ncbi:MAG: hypothetical protein ABIT61_06440 [Steroidobacteraceae bacterium]